MFDEIGLREPLPPSSKFRFDNADRIDFIASQIRYKPLAMRKGYAHGDAALNAAAIPLDSAFLDSGSSAPTVPGSLRALGIASNEIIIVWEPSLDDVAVLEYNVVRNGSLIATTPYPVYIDTNLLEVQPYSYQIIAIDRAGNQSTASIPTIASPLLITDDIPPPAPKLLMKLAVTGSAIQLLWGQDSINDVVRFNLYRGTGSQTPVLTPRVSDKTATDIYVQESETYCYQVTAIVDHVNINFG